MCTRRPSARRSTLDDEHVRELDIFRQLGLRAGDSPRFGDVAAAVFNRASCCCEKLEFVVRAQGTHEDEDSGKPRRGVLVCATDAACPAPANADPVCTGGACDFTCRSGFTRSGASCVESAAHDTWATVASMPSARGYLAAVAGADGRIYAIGGYNGPSSYLATVEAYTPSTNT